MAACRQPGAMQLTPDAPHVPRTWSFAVLNTCAHCSAQASRGLRCATTTAPTTPTCCRSCSRSGASAASCSTARPSRRRRSSTTASTSSWRAWSSASSGTATTPTGSSSRWAEPLPGRGLVASLFHVLHVSFTSDPCERTPRHCTWGKCSTAITTGYLKGCLLAGSFSQRRPAGVRLLSDCIVV